MNWRGRPLTSHDVVINSIAATTTRTGLTVQARLDDGTYPTGVKVTSAQMAALPVSRHPFHGDWNYTLHPAAGHPAGPPASNDQERRPAALPELTGLAPGDLDQLIAVAAGRGSCRREDRCGQPGLAGDRCPDRGEDSEVLVQAGG
jgi:Rhodopirellula transposase DDE domain